MWSHVMRTRAYRKDTPVATRGSTDPQQTVSTSPSRKHSNPKFVFRALTIRRSPIGEEKVLLSIGRNLQEIPGLSPYRFKVVGYHMWFAFVFNPLQHPKVQPRFNVQVRNEFEQQATGQVHLGHQLAASGVQL